MHYLKQTAAYLGFVLIMALCNLHLLFGMDPAALVFDATLVADGQWWRLVTHPFVHVSWYHLLVDSAAVILLWRELRLPSKLQKIMAAICCAGASLLFALIVSDQVTDYGLCGFSGTAHGLAFLLGLKWVAESLNCHGNYRGYLAAAGLFLSIATAAKSLYEVISGAVFLSRMHMGEIGIPIVGSHLGGVFGGMAAAAILLACSEKSFGSEAKMVDNANRNRRSYVRPGTSAHLDSISNE